VPVPFAWSRAVGSSTLALTVPQGSQTFFFDTSLKVPHRPTARAWPARTDLARGAFGVSPGRRPRIGAAQRAEIGRAEAFRIERRLR
jgi:hypothetical protein